MSRISDEAERARQRALDTYRIVDTLPEAAYDDIVRIASLVCGAPVALISLLDRDRQWFKARIGIDVAETPRNEAVCDHAIRRPQQLFEVRDLAGDPRFAQLPVVTGAEAMVGSIGEVLDDGKTCDLVMVASAVWEPITDADRLLGEGGPAGVEDPLRILRIELYQPRFERQRSITDERFPSRIPTRNKHMLVDTLDQRILRRKISENG